MFDFNGKVVFLTAAAGAGIGRAIARKFAAAGAKVVLSDQHERRTVEAAEEIAAETGADVVGFPLDVRDGARIDAVVDAVYERHGRLDIVINNSGLNDLAPIWDMTDDVWQRTVDISLTAHFRVIRRALKYMRDQRSGVVVNTSSIAGWMGTNEGESHYAASKAGVMGLTRAAAIECAPFGIRVNAVAPGLAMNAFLAKIYDQSYIDNMVARTPLGRAGTPEDIANAVLFLASDHASFITGEVLCVSGGLHLHT
ncbi:SDR family NAD(P)-dependent oxidoreductase [Streptomyces sp. NPDC001984]